MKKLFEVPYNFDETLVAFYKRHSQHISFIYLPPYKDDLSHTRSSIQTPTKGHCYMPQSRDEYETHLRLINSAGLRFVVLWQIRDSIITKEQLDYYSCLNSSGFIIGNNENAKIIKEYNPYLIVICSLVQRLRSNILNRDLSYYDYIILYYNYNRSLNKLKELESLKDKIILMPNTLCNIKCPSLHHWFPSKEKPFDYRYDCWTNIDTLDKCGFIFPEHLKFFNEYVGGYKLQGREYSTKAIKYLCRFYFEEIFRKDFVNPFLRKDMADKLYILSHSVPEEIYYNMGD